MLIYGIYKYVQNASWQCLIDYDISGLPVDVLRIAKMAGIVIRKNTEVGILSGGESGKSYLDTENNKWYLVYDDECSIARRCFIVAHESGHIFLGHEIQGKMISNCYYNKMPNWESQADAFALRLLAPACVLWGLRLHTENEIAAVCNLPIQSAKKRAQRMKEFYQRGKFLSSPLERQLYCQFEDFIKTFRT